jgi:hypothetical protein
LGLQAHVEPQDLVHGKFVHERPGKAGEQPVLLEGVAYQGPLWLAWDAELTPKVREAKRQAGRIKLTTLKVQEGYLFLGD